MWKYISPIGSFYIKYLPDCHQYGTIFKGTVWETCDDPEASASNVYCHCIGCYDWDSLDGAINDVPHDLSEWKKI